MSDRDEFERDLMWAEYERDQQELQRAVEDAILHAHALGLPKAECMTLAYGAGVPNEIWKELR